MSASRGSSGRDDDDRQCSVRILQPNTHNYPKNDITAMHHAWDTQIGKSAEAGSKEETPEEKRQELESVVSSGEPELGLLDSSETESDYDPGDRLIQMASFKTEEDIERFEKEKDVASSLRRASNTVRNLLICAAFVAFEVAKQVITYGVKEYNAGQYPISLSTIVVLIEMVKLTTCLVIFGYQGGLKTIKFSWRFAVPSFIYGINNNLFLYALHFTPPPVWNVLIQSRVIMTALIYRFVFKRDVPPMRWLALLLLMFGISLSQLSGSSTAQVGTETSAYILLKAVFLSLISAGLSTAASIYTEYLFKNDRRPFMEQQIQLYFYGVLMTSVWALYVTRGKPLEIQGNLNMTITWLLVLTILLGGAGGLLVAAIIKNIDNIAKIYSATFAIFLTAILCSMLFPANFKLNFMFVCALFFILISSWMYERFKPKPADSATNGETPSTNTIVAVPRELNGNASMLKAELKS